MCAGLAAGWAVIPATAGRAPDGATGRAVSPGCTEETLSRFSPVVSWHAARYPDLEVEDLYKLLHQAVAGPAHAIEDPDMALQWLEREWAELEGPLEGEEVFEPLSADGRLVRVNLRPWRAAGHSPEAVLSAFVRTAETLPPDSARIRVELDAISACSDRIAGGLRLSATELQSFFSDRERDGYPMIHHSEKYTQAYQPAYRVVFRSYLD